MIPLGMIRTPPMIPKTEGTFSVFRRQTGTDPEDDHGLTPAVSGFIATVADRGA
jgi:hypothetical protein